jgi:aldehyde dehydrogenase (NAD+)
MTVATETSTTDLLSALGLSRDNPGAFDGEWIDTQGPALESVNPTTGEVIASIRTATAEDYERVVTTAVEAFEAWRTWPAPLRGEVVRQLGLELRQHKEALGRLVTLEMGKILSEGLGEVQEMIDMVDLAVGMSRQLCGLSMHSERPEHRMTEQWHPLGPVGIITAFNFPVAVWAWNSTVAAICGDSMIWKPSAKTPLCGLAVTRIAQKVLEANDAPPIFGLAIGDRHQVGGPMVADRRVPLISATGSVAMGRKVGEVVANRLGRSLLELGGNNGIIVMDDADLDLALRAVLFAAVGTAGQRCTTNRRLLLQRGIAAEMKERLKSAYGSISIGDPLDPEILMGPLVDGRAVEDMKAALEVIKGQGGKVIYGGGILDRPGYFVERRSSSTTACPRGCRRRSLPPTCCRPSAFCRRPVPTAVSRTSTSALRAPRSVAPLVVKRRPVAAARPAPTPGSSTCADRPAPSTTAPSCRWRRASSSTSAEAAGPTTRLRRAVPAGRGGWE